MCCGQRRAELKNGEPQTMARSARQALFVNRPIRTSASSSTPTIARPWPGNAQNRGEEAPATTTRSSIEIRYLENSPIRVRGVVSGVSYEFSGAAAIRQVDARDAPSLLNTRFFRRA
jgi:hypothetical protein